MLRTSAALLVALLTAQVPSSPSLALVGGRVYTSPDAIPIDDAAVLVEGGRIAAVGPRASLDTSRAARTIDCKGLVVVAGFQNSHVHFTHPRWAEAASQPAAKLVAQLEEMLTRHGFTTVVDTASDPANTLALRKRIDSGEVAGPAILTAGMALYPPDGVPYYVRDEVPAEILRLLPQPATAAAATSVVSTQLGGGTDIVKLFVGSWVKRGSVLPMPQDVANAAVAEAHKRGALVFAHPSNVAGLEVALRAGVDVLAHAVEHTRGLTDAHRQRMLDQKMAVVPTLFLFSGRWSWDVGDEVRRFSRAGGQLLFGTDAGYLQQFDPTREYELMASAGIDWREILASLTTSPAARFRRAEERGRIAKSMPADLVVLGSDPSSGARSFADVRTTIRGGRVIYSRPPGEPPGAAAARPR
jgi:imidazolonepropionase-like amidohydrolase